MPSHVGFPKRLRVAADAPAALGTHDRPVETPHHTRRDLKRIAGIVVGLSIVAVVFTYVLPKIADYGQVWHVVTTLSWWWILALVAASTLFILSDAPPWMTVLPGLGYLNALRMDLAGSALSQVLPGGAAVNVATQFGMLRSWGFQGRPVALAVSLTTLWNQFVTFGFPVIAIGALSLEGGHEGTLGPVALAGLVIVALLAGTIVAVLWSPDLARRLGDGAARGVTWAKAVFHKDPVGWAGDDLVRFRAEAIELLRHRWPALTLTTLVNQLAVFLVLLVSLRALGVGRAQVDLVEAFAAWSLVRALGSIPITPGGLGVEEVALSGALVGFGAGNAKAVAATLLYRFMTVVPSVVLGLIAVATYKLGKPKLRPTPKLEPHVEAQ
jgi:putative heme transporter